MRQLFEPEAGHTTYTVRLSGAEIVAAFFLRERTGSLSAADAQAATLQFKLDFENDYQIVEIVPLVVERAMELAESCGLRGYDSVQLAAAVLLQEVRASLVLEPITFVCADERLNRTATTLGLTVDNPNDHTTT